DDSYFRNGTSEINIGQVDRTFNIKEKFPEIELDRITSVTGGEINLTTGVVSNYRNEKPIEYTYRSGTIENGRTVFLRVQLSVQTHATPRAQEILVVQGREPNPADGIANKESLMEGTTYEWEGGVPNTSEIGIVTGNVLLHYPDGFDDRVDNVSVNVGVEINEENFPDAKFREYISGRFDKNRDGILSSTELDAVAMIDVKNVRELTSLKGVEYFTNLTNLFCQGTGITSIDVSKNTALRVLHISDTYLEAIDVSKNKVLGEFGCSNMPNLTSINVQGASALRIMYCYKNPKLRGLDVSGNTNLEKLWIKSSRDPSYYGTDLAWLKMGEHPKLKNDDSYFRNGTSEINIGQVDRTFNIKEMFPEIELDRITRVTGADIDLTTGVVSNYRNEQNITYQYRSGTIGNGSTVYLTVQLSFQTHATPRAQEIVVVQGREPNPADGIANKGSLMEGTTYEWEGGAPDTSEIGIVTGNVLLHYPDGFDDRVDNVRVNVGIEINEENFPDAKFREYISGSKFDKNQDGILSSTELDAVTYIDVDYVREVTSVKGIEYFKNLETLKCTNTGITSIDVSKNTALRVLKISGTYLEEIDVSKNPSLKELYCSDMPNLTSINVQGASVLTDLLCYNSPKLRGLDVSGSPKLKRLWIKDSGRKGTDLAWLKMGTHPNLENKSDYFKNSPSEINMGEVDRTFNIKEQFPGIDPTKITSISGATIDKETGVVV
ncbi:MAG: hypothetical protein K2F55_03180, partial [Erysipelotrichaceae bacterium]|nr:hypothetical protein [Erysipelotrichaceae bacterium]